MKKRGACGAEQCGCAERPYSSVITDPVERAASRAMLHAVGFSREDFKKPQVGIASTWSMVTPCNMHIDRLARDAAAGVDKAGGKGVIFGTITIDAVKRSLSLGVPASEIRRRLAAWKAPKPRYVRGVLGKYARVVRSASEGALTDVPE